MAVAEGAVVSWERVGGGCGSGWWWCRVLGACWRWLWCLQVVCVGGKESRVNSAVGIRRVSYFLFFYFFFI